MTNYYQRTNFNTNIPKLCCRSCQKEMGMNHFVRHNRSRCDFYIRLRLKKEGKIPTHGKTGRKGISPWNKGLTKETDERVANIGKTIAERIKTGKIILKRQSSNEKVLYRSDCRFLFNVYNYPNYFDLDLLEQYRWYHPIENPKGVSRDHIISINFGWNHGFDSKLISHPANCRLMLHIDNNKKKCRSDIAIKELNELVQNWVY